ncbi:MAG: hypothetical protein CMF60_04615 [Magnetococcales bacterium]|nr:hypothetical protein [Magnetococcales bacterium]|tara:strand:- start:14116 stop:14685 length:570 start_codon:yes stop_codon:yes gene_type:complete
MGSIVLTKAEMELRQSYGMIYQKTDVSVVLPMGSFKDPQAVKDQFLNGDSQNVTDFREDNVVYLMEEEDSIGRPFMGSNTRFTKLTVKCLPRVINQTELEGFRAHGVNFQFNPAWESYRSGFYRSISSCGDQGRFLDLVVSEMVLNAINLNPDAEAFVVTDITITVENKVKSPHYVGGCALVPVYEKLD